MSRKERLTDCPECGNAETSSRSPFALEARRKFGVPHQLCEIDAKLKEDARPHWGDRVWPIAGHVSKLSKNKKTFCFRSTAQENNADSRENFDDVQVRVTAEKRGTRCEKLDLKLSACGFRLTALCSHLSAELHPAHPV